MTNKEIYEKWEEYQAKEGFPKFEYPVEAYTQKAIDLWKRILIKKNIIGGE